jgi:hypothetical protein
MQQTPEEKKMEKIVRQPQEKVRFIGEVPEIWKSKANLVSHIRTTDGIKGWRGTGFLFTTNWLMTNSHVFPSAAAARNASLEFEIFSVTLGPDPQRLTIYKKLREDNHADFTVPDIAIVRLTDNDLNQLAPHMTGLSGLADVNFALAWKYLRDNRSAPTKKGAYNNTVVEYKQLISRVYLIHVSFQIINCRIYLQF